MTQIADAEQRRLALDPERSFIVQAPAGSGKTELLIQRYLGLLSRVENPEEILAITFTRKAAAEMRNRVLAAIARAAENIAPEQAHERTTWELARQAGQKDAEKNWQMEKYPSRMRIMTIDSLCAGLTRQMPVLSGFGAPARITDDPDALYARAARETVAAFEGGKNRSGAVEALVRHLDNRLSTLENLVALMLPRRDQWMRHVARADDPQRLRPMLESALEAVIGAALSDLRSRFPEAAVSDLADLARFAASNLAAAGAESPIIHARNLSGLPGTDPSDLTVWQGLAELLLTRSGEWRKDANKNLGFPAPGSAKADPERKMQLERRKSRFKALLEDLSGDLRLAEDLDMVRRLPAPAYTDSQWAVLEALFEVLWLSVGKLQAVFAMTGEVDFAETAIRARIALGDPEDPTDLALSLDYRISHILMDEFQDTSISQFELMQGLTAGWAAGDGRTFFAVGDPMQSIYGFREAEVGLFLKAWEQGLDVHVPLERLVLKSNFRSEAGIVEWVNSVFSMVLPDTGDADTGAVPYMPAAPVVAGNRDPAVSVHPLIEADDADEADNVLDCVNHALDADPEGTVAVLVRSRNHLKTIVSGFRRAGLRFSAVEIDSLADRPVIRDLVSLTRALSHPADRIAWLAVLRAPWCGLTLKDLHGLAGMDTSRTVYDLIHDESPICAMSQDGQNRLQRVRPVLDEAMTQRDRRSLRRRVESAWTAMGGPATAASPGELADVPVYFDYVDAHLGIDPLTDVAAFEQGVFGLFAQPDAGADQRLQIMTIHKAKGLEFDTVIIPGLGKSPRSQDPSLLLWQERAGAPAGQSLLMAPISETGAEKDAIYQYIQQLQQIRRDYETGRLLYVAATRAIKRLHLFGRASLDKAGSLCRPDSRSLLRVLWPAVRENFETAAREDRARSLPPQEAPQRASDCRIRRLVADCKLPRPYPDASESAGKPLVTGPEAIASFSPRFDWAGITLRHVGTVVHQWLRIICENGLENWNRQRVYHLRDLLQRDLMRIGVCSSDIEAAVSQAEKALINAVTDHAGRWILSSHFQGACEYAVSGIVSHEVVNAVIDRTFVDDLGVRWVIDYKSGAHGGGGLADFLDREQARYTPQMDRYGELMKKLDDRPLRLGLYFPMIPAWRQWSE